MSMKKRIGLAFAGTVAAVTLVLAQTTAVEAALCGASTTSWPGSVGCPGSSINDHEGVAFGLLFTQNGGPYNAGQKVLRVNHWGPTGSPFGSTFSTKAWGINASSQIISGCFAMETTYGDTSEDTNGCQSAVRLKMQVVY